MRKKASNKCNGKKETVNKKAKYLNKSKVCVRTLSPVTVNKKAKYLNKSKVCVRTLSPV